MSDQTQATQPVTLNTVVQEIVTEFTRAEKMFTAHDVTLEARNRKQKAFHDPVKAIVHDMYERGLFGIAYTRTQIQVPNSGLPWLFHIKADDPVNYTDIRGVQSSVVQPTGQIVVPPAVDPSQIVVPSSTQTDTTVDPNIVDNSINVVKNNNLSLVTNAYPNHILHDSKSVIVPISKNNVRNKAGSGVDRILDKRQRLSIPANFMRAVGFQPNNTAYVVVLPNAIEIYSTPPNSGSALKYNVDKHVQIRIGSLSSLGLSAKKFDIIQEPDKIVATAKP